MCPHNSPGDSLGSVSAAQGTHRFPVGRTLVLRAETAPSGGSERGREFLPCISATEEHIEGNAHWTGIQTQMRSNMERCKQLHLQRYVPAEIAGEKSFAEHSVFL